MDDLRVRKTQHYREEAKNDLSNLLPPRLRRADPKINRVEHSKIQVWVGMWPQVRRGLYLHGEVGVGKTYACAAILGALAETTDKRLRMAWVSVPLFLRNLKKSYSAGGGEEGVVWGQIDGDIVVLDDLREPGTEWQRETLGLAIEHLYDSDTLCLVTGNGHPQELWPKLGRHIRSRLHEMVAPLFMDGTDRRMEPLPPRTRTPSEGSS